MCAIRSVYMHERGRLLGNSPKMDAVREMMEKAAKVDLPLLIMGETGTGKDLVARALHQKSKRANGPFVVVNTGAVSRELISSEIFGHVKGAFTSAETDRVGRYEEADGGSLFLDEIGTMDEGMQVALLRVIEDGTFRPVGAREDKTSDVRLIGATNVDLEGRVADGMFREDLLHRLKVLCIKVPALRDRVEDIPELAEHFVQMLNKEFGFSIRSICPDTIKCLQDNYDWPGNVRELKNAMAQAAVLAEEGTILPAHLPNRICDDEAKETGPVDCDESDLPAFQGEYARTASRRTGVPSAHARSAAGSKEIRAIENNGGRNGKNRSRNNGNGSAPVTALGPATQPANEGLVMPVGHTFDDVLKDYAILTLLHCKGNKTKAAKMLGISRKTLHDRLAKWEIGKVLDERSD